MNTLSRAEFLRGRWATGSAGYHPSDAYRADIGRRCLAVNQILCRSCEDSCELEAISFKPKRNGVPAPAVNTDLCNGCGECFRLCPAGAIKMIAAQRTEIPSSPDNPFESPTYD